MKHLCLFLIFASLIAFIPTLHAQDKSWNLLLEKKADRFLGFQVFEFDSSYCVWGPSIASFDSTEQGFSISKINKVNASTLAQFNYYEKGVEYGIYKNRFAYIGDSNIYIIQNSNTLPPKATIFQSDITTLETKKLYSFSPPQSASSLESMYLYDFLLDSKIFYILLKYYSGVYNTPTFEAHSIVVKVNCLSFTVDTFYLNSGLPSKIGLNRMINFNNGLLIFGYVPGESIATGKLLLYYYDFDGNLIWQYQTPSISSIHDIRDVYPINDKEVMLVSYDSYFDYSDHNLYSRWTVTRFDVENKKIVWSNFWNEPRKPYIWDSAKIVKTKKEGEFLLMANDYIGNDTSSYTTGKVIKFNDKGDRIWQKTYYYRKVWSLSNDFNNIKLTSDNNFLIVGYESLGRSPWLVKIDEDGNILPIDTTSSTGDIYSTTISLPEIKVYPNPASHTIIINQGEITDMTYLLTDIHGRTIKSIPLPHAHHHVVWDINDVVSGTYVLQMRQGDKVIGTKQIVVVK